MGKAQCFSMEELPMAFQSPARSIDFITSYRMANIGHVNPDLVGSPGLQLQLDQAIIPETLQDLETSQPLSYAPVRTVLYNVPYEYGLMEPEYK